MKIKQVWGAILVFFSGSAFSITFESAHSAAGFGLLQAGAEEVHSSLSVGNLWCDHNPNEVFWVECEGKDLNDGGKRVHTYNTKRAENTFKALARKKYGFP